MDVDAAYLHVQINLDISFDTERVTAACGVYTVTDELSFYLTTNTEPGGEKKDE